MHVTRFRGRLVSQARADGIDRTSLGNKTFQIQKNFKLSIKIRNLFKVADGLPELIVVDEVIGSDTCATRIPPTGARAGYPLDRARTAAAEPTARHAHAAPTELRADGTLERERN